MQRIAIVLGTRPEIIKMSPVIRALDKHNSEHRALNSSQEAGNSRLSTRNSELEYFILHTGKHYSYNLDRVFFEQLQLPQPKYNLEVGSGTHAEETGKMLIGIERVLLEEKPDVVLVEGDTNSVLAGALAAAKLHIKVGHVEAGLRSYDRRMPEEINRILTDHLSDFLFAPTENARDNLLKEGIPEEKIFVTGNTIVDAVFQNLEMAKEKQPIIELNKFDNPGTRNYFLVTFHRQENVDVKVRFEGIIKGLELVAKEFGLPVVYPIHPRARKMMMEFELKANGIELIEPLDYLSFLRLEADARLVLTDSGGVQEEACILGVPCVTLRDNTERPETLEVGLNILAGTKAERIVSKTKEILNRENKWRNPFGDGRAGERIVEIWKEFKVRGFKVQGS